ncbi:MAG: Nucleotidyltransferase domain protein [Candidatus Scalindua rubra]|uniref:Nucleotidyltransferase domain protein n=1 Tax=Candidatus Scalindua rubra TaxID=1872076 RepID=A0A1E3XEH5_9BACT|nr:MAG: Nucleotidyltransferase domain protein [Candidatus Scalindua rubra]
MNEKDRELILKFKNRLPSDVKGHLRQIIVFGSRVKGEAKEDSDIDVIALVDKKTPEIERKLEDVAYQVMWDHDFKPIISLKVFAELQFNNAIKKGFSFYEHVQKEGFSV